jgi:hypothetical protein
MITLAHIESNHAPSDQKVETDVNICPFKEVNRSPDSFVRVSTGRAMSGSD